MKNYINWCLVFIFVFSGFSFLYGQDKKVSSTTTTTVATKNGKTTDDSSGKKKVIGIKSKGSLGNVKNAINDYNLLIENILKRIILLTVAYEPALDYADNSSDEIILINETKKTAMVGLFDKEQSKSFVRGEFRNKDLLLFYNVNFDIDSNGLKVYYFNLAQFDLKTNQEFEAVSYSMTPEEFENNLIRTIWNLGLKYFRLPQIGFTSNSNVAIKDYQDKKQWGTLKIKTIPSGAKIYVDEGLVGTTTENEYIVIPHYKGDVRIQAEKEGFFTCRKFVTVNPGDNTVLDLPLDQKKGILIIKTNLKDKSGLVKFNGQSWVIKNGIVQIDNFPVGKNYITIMAEDYKTIENFEVEVREKKEGKTTKDVKLEFRDIEITVDCNIKDPQVYLDGEFKGRGVPLVIKGVRQGKHQIKVFHEDYGSDSNDINVDTPEDRKMSFVLKEKGELPPYKFNFFKLWIGQLWIDDGPVVGNINYLLNDGITRQMAVVGNMLNVAYMFSFFRGDFTFLFLHGDNYSNSGLGSVYTGHKFYSFDLIFSFYFNFSLKKYLFDPLGFKKINELTEANKVFPIVFSDFIIDIGLSYLVNLHRQIDDLRGGTSYDISNYWHYTNFYFTVDFLTFLKLVKNPFFDKLTISFPLYINLASQYGNPNVIWSFRLGVTL